MMPKDSGWRRGRTSALCVLLTGLALAGCDSQSPQEKARAFAEKAEAAAAAQRFSEAVIQYKNAIQLQREDPELRLKLGRLYLDLGNGEAAAKEIAKAREFGAADRTTAEALARAWLLAGDPARALQVVGQQPSSPDLRAIRGLALLQQNNLDEAERQLRESLAARKSAEAYVGLAQVAFRRRDFDDAGKHADAALALEARNSLAVLVKAEALRALNDPRKALDVLAAFDRGEGADARIQALRVALLIQARRTPDAAQALTVLNEAAPEAPITRLLTAQLHLLRQEFADAKSAAEGLLALQPSHQGGLLIAATANLALGRHESARQQLNRLLAMTPGHEAATRLMAHLRAVEARGTDGADGAGDSLRLARAGNGEQAAASDAGSSSDVDGLLDNGDIEDSGGDLLKRVRQGLTALQEGRHDDALRIGAGLAESYPENAAGPNIQGLAHMGRKEMAAAEKAFEEAFSREPANVSAVLNLAEVRRHQGDLTGAGEILAAASEVADHPRVLMARARIEMERGNYGPAEELLGKAVEAQTEGHDALVALGRFYLVRNRPDDALAAVKEAAAEQPGDIRLGEVEAMAQMQLGNAEAAAATFEELAGSSDNQRYRLEAARAYLSAGNRARAMEALRAALDKDPEQIAARTLLAEQLLAAGETDAAKAEIAELARRQPDSAGTFSLQGRHAVLAGDLDGAIAHFNDAMVRDPRPATVMNLARAQRLAGRRGAARQTLAEWLAEHPEDVGVRSDLASLMIEAEDWQGAAAQYRSLLRENGGNAASYNNLAYAEMKLGNLSEAAAHAGEALSLAPGNPAILDTLAEIQLERGDAESAVENFRKAHEASPETPIYSLHLARALLAAGKTGEARSILEDVLDTHGGQTPVGQEARALLDDVVE